MKTFILVFSLLSSIIIFSQEKIQPSFTGKLTYKGTLVNGGEMGADSSAFMTIYCNDSVVRIETYNIQIGKQVYIEHLVKRKSYLLLFFEGKKFAIQSTDTSSLNPSSEYKFKKKFGSKKILGIKCKKVLVSHPDFKKPLLMYYTKDISSKYNKAVTGIQGLPVDYYLNSPDGIMHYTLVRYETGLTDLDRFAIPTDFKRVSFDQFMEEIGK